MVFLLPEFFSHEYAIVYLLVKNHFCIQIKVQP